MAARDSASNTLSSGIMSFIDNNNARLEGLNGIFKAARARARGYRNVATFITIIYLIAAPIGYLLNSI